MTATNLSVQVHNASFSGYGVNGNGGALLLSATDYANITVTNSSFEDTSSFGAFKGGAIHLECWRSTVKLNRCVFKGNKAGSGGAVSIHEFRSLSKSVENVTQRKDHYMPKTNTEPLLNVDITDCMFKAASSYSTYGGAVSIVGPKILVRSLNSTFTDCSAHTSGGALYVGSIFQMVESVALYVENSRFIGCRNNGEFDGAVYVSFGALTNVTFKETLFESSSSTGYGGGVAIIKSYSAMSSGKD